MSRSLLLSKPGYLRDLLARSRWEFAVAAILIAGGLTMGVLEGIALGKGKHMVPTTNTPSKEHLTGLPCIGFNPH